MYHVVPLAVAQEACPASLKVLTSLCRHAVFRDISSYLRTELSRSLETKICKQHGQQPHRIRSESRMRKLVSYDLVIDSKV